MCVLCVSYQTSLETKKQVITSLLGLTIWAPPAAHCLLATHWPPLINPSPPPAEVKQDEGSYRTSERKLQQNSTKLIPLQQPPSHHPDPSRPPPSHHRPRLVWSLILSICCEVLTLIFIGFHYWCSDRKNFNRRKPPRLTAATNLLVNSDGKKLNRRPSLLCGSGL